MNSDDAHARLHLHVFDGGEEIFSKSQLKAQRYDKIDVEGLDTSQVKLQALKIASELGTHVESFEASELEQSVKVLIISSSYPISY